MTTIDPSHLDETLSAYLDGELDDDERQEIEQLLEHNADDRRSLEALRRTVGLVASLPRRAAPGSIADELTAQLERGALLDGLGDEPTRSGRGWPTIAAWVGVAAMIGIVSVTGVWVYQKPNALFSNVKESAVAMASSTVDETTPPDMKKDEKKESGTSGESIFQGGGRRQSRPRRRSKARAPMDVRRERKAASKAKHRRTINGPPSFVEDSTHLLLAQRGIDLDTKLAAGGDLNVVRSHPFGSELVRLKVRLPSGGDMESVLQAVATCLSDSGVSDLAELPRNAKELRGGFYFRGVSHVNYGEGAEGQMLVRLPVRALSDLVTHLADATDSDDDITLVAGSLEFVGLSNTRDTLRRLRGVNAGESTHGASTTPKKPDPEAPALWDEILRAVGLDGSFVDALTEPADTPSRSVPAAGKGERFTFSYDADHAPIVGPPHPKTRPATSTIASKRDETEFRRKLDSLGYAGSIRVDESAEAEHGLATANYEAADDVLALRQAAEPTSLVERRLRTAREARRVQANQAVTLSGGLAAEAEDGKRLHELAKAAQPVSGDDALGAELFVTLVIEVSVAPQADRYRATPAKTSRRGKPSRPTHPKPKDSSRPPKK